MLKTVKIVIRAAKPIGLAVLVASALAGCGQTGPLYLPNEQNPNVPAPDASANENGVLTTNTGAAQ
ncbi:hypothetical protein E9531_12040 [Lampropedia puyangensis]|uniref:Lipoprotein n=1 Tax=Lampropedia puyangensis TaxID=1330072 RepID=A0A4S8F0B3_9BURK|nr:lipoprotein [Lampropedia puyangensis]THT99674.1 hypothetical protein E9531_12040 [Lampropedia puyangensis]